MVLSELIDFAGIGKTEFKELHLDYTPNSLKYDGEVEGGGKISGSWFKNGATETSSITYDNSVSNIEEHEKESEETVNTEECKFSDIRIYLNLEHKGSERLICVSLAHNLIAVFVMTNCIRNIKRGRKIVNHCIKHGLHTFVLV